MYTEMILPAEIGTKLLRMNTLSWVIRSVNTGKADNTVSAMVTIGTSASKRGVGQARGELDTAIFLEASPHQEQKTG